MITIYFEAHATSLDNEAGIASGHNDVELSEAGRNQARGEKRQRYENVELDAVFTSDLRRAYDTAKIMFEGKDVPIFLDSRLRECDYGDLTKAPRPQLEAVRSQSISKPFPNGESLEQAMERMKSFLADLSNNYEGKTLVVIGHAATRFGLEHHINGISLKELLSGKLSFYSKYILG